jgi:hypothetical protein
MASDPETGIITDERLTRAAGEGNGEPDVAAGFVAAEPGAGEQASDGPAPASDAGTARGDGEDRADREDGACRWYGDSAYGTGDLRDAIGKAGDQAVIKPKPLRPAVPGGFTLDHDARQATCPAGITGRSARPAP